MPLHDKPYKLQPALFAALVLALCPAAPAAQAPRARLRDLGIVIGDLPTGRWNAITDVPGVKVGQVTLHWGHGNLVPGVGPVRTGVTAIVPRDDVWHHKVFAGSFVLNGNGELTGMHWVKEAGWLETPILLTETLSVPQVANGVVSWMEHVDPDMAITDDVVLPVVGECDDEFLNDERGRHVTAQDAMTAIESATSGPVAEGSVGAGTGMVSFRFKGGIGTSSRIIPASEGGYTVGVLVNTNTGLRQDLRIDGVPVGKQIPDFMPVFKRSAALSSAKLAVARPDDHPSESSILIVVATNAPLLPIELDRLARRAAIGLALAGGTSHNSSGDIILAFSTGNDVPHYPPQATMSLVAVNQTHMDPLFQATIEATQEAIGNALCMATTTDGRDGHVVYALPLDRLKAIMRQFGRLEP
ncbi:MAG: P1 family peptidase [Cyanobacteria bacterium REEB65]|nr:P1 family peptidase [Cyanobacteria bacterium REEB65]